MAKNETKPSKNADKYNIRRWSVPSKRAKGYAEDRKAKVHTYAPKEGKELTDYEAGMRSGYLQAQSDHAGLYKYKKALITYNNHEPIISQELWDKVHDRMKSIAQGRKTGSGFVHPLSGFLVCADCGSKLKMSGHANHTKTEYLYHFNCGLHLASVLRYRLKK